ncbi:maltooligosyl trehalose synthase [Calothrix sp. HK-06]|nr:maltooligosyl trehalose synthase [Calothrix sp. HK-06]
MLDSKTIFFCNPNPKIEVNYQLQSLTFELDSNCHYLGRERRQDSNGTFKVPDDWTIFSRYQACFRKIGDNYYIYDGDGEINSKNGLFINEQLITPIEGYCLKDGDEIKVGQNPLFLATIVYINPKTPVAAPPKQRSIYLDKKTVILGRNHNADFELDAPTVSRRHAVINTDAQGRYILRDYSANGVFINRQKVLGTSVLSPGDMIQIGPYSLVLQGNELVLVDQGDNIRLDARNLVQVVSTKNKQKRRLLDDISLAIEPGQLVALVGGSGAGKSTLMKSLLGIESLTEGVVYLNGDDLKRNFNIYRNLIGYVPQHDIVHTNLTVKEILYYAAKLRLSPDINVETVIEKTLKQVELSEHQNTLAKNLSGGQLKRVSIAVELLADPKLFFLDEPTSGLDPGLDKEMMQLLRGLANSGRTIILVTHATTNINLCDRLVFLGAGGKLCYYGTPSKAIDFFQIDSEDFADIYIKLKSKYNVVEEAERYSQSEYKREFVDNKLREFNQEQYQPPQQANYSLLQQLSILIQRYVKLISRDTVNLALVLFTAPIAIALITLAIQGKSPLVGQPDYERASLARTVLFIFTCASMWIGLASSLQEIVKESAIYLRERLVNLSLLSYLGSKILTLGGLGVIQSFLISIIILIGFESPAPKLIISYIYPEDNPFISIPWFLGVFITTFLSILASVSLGLMVSASVKNNTQANSALPILLLPQIIFSGVLFNIDKIQVGKYLSWLMLSRWSVGAYGILARINLLVPGHSQENTPIKESPMYDSDLKNLALNWSILVLYTVIYLAITLWLQKQKDVVK